MARFLFGTMPVTGHVAPGLSIARELIARGHEVVWTTGSRFRSRVEASGARFVPLSPVLDWDDRNPEAHFPEIARLKGLPRLKYDLKHVFAAAIPQQIEDLKAILREFPADAVVGDTAFAGPGRLHEMGQGPAWAVFNVTALTVPSIDTAPFGLGIAPDPGPVGRLRNRLLYRLCDDVLFRDVSVHYAGVRASLGLPRGGANIFAEQVSPYLFLQNGVEGFEYPRSDLGRQIHFVGTFAPEPPAAGWERPSWWPELSAGKRVVLLTQGTFATSHDALIRPALEALATEDVLVVVTTANKTLEGPVPANARVASFLPYGELLPHVDLLVTNGGYGTTQMALAHGVPVIGCGHTEDKPEICQRIETFGVGLRIRPRNPSPEVIRAAVRRVLSEPSFAAKARAVRDEFAGHDAPRECGDLLERLAATGRPVLRDAGFDRTASGSHASKVF